MKPKITIALAVFLALALAFSFYPGKKVTVTVTADNGTPIAFADIVIRDMDSNILITAISAEKGNTFTLPDSITEITIDVFHAGYERSNMVTKLKAQETMVNFQLQPEAEELHEMVVKSHSTKRNYAPVMMSRSKKAVRQENVSVGNGAVYQKQQSNAPPPAFKLYHIPSDNREYDRVGNLTAGEIHDFSKWKLWSDIGQTELNNYMQTWQLYPQNRISVQMINQRGFPVVDEEVRLVMNKPGKVLWTSRTDNTGKAELWLDPQDMPESGNELLKNLKIRTRNGLKILEADNVRLFEDGIVNIMVNSRCNPSDLAEIAFVIDATGSMQDEIDYLKEDLLNIVDEMAGIAGGVEVRTGSVFYKCFGNDYVTQTSPLNNDLSVTREFVRSHSANDGGTEAVEEALRVAIDSMNWSETARTRIMFLILDEPPGHDAPIVMTLHEQISRAAAKGIRIVPVVSSGVAFGKDKSLEYLMRSIALLTNGTYVFLTDDSGIGNAHTAPSTDHFDTEKLNDIFRRLIKQYTFMPPCPKDPVITGIVPETDYNNPDTSALSSDSMPGSGDTLYAEIPVPPHFDTAAIRDSWVVYPVPTKGPLTVKPPQFAQTVYLTDLSGKLLMKSDAAGGPIRWNIASFSEGIYFIKAEGDNRMDTKRIILAH